MENVNIKINGLDVSAPKGSTILEAARLAHIEIPTLCFLKGINEIGACRMCVCEVKNARTLVAACVFPINEGMEIFTNTPRVLESRKKTLELLLSDHDKKCLSCVRSQHCELQELAKEVGVTDQDFYAGEMMESDLDTSAPHMVRDNNKCILCRRCVAACEKFQSVGVIGPNFRGFKTHIGSPFEMGLADTACVDCGQCIAVCPTGALYEKDFTDRIIEDIHNPEKHVIVQTAPSVRAGLGEMFGYPIGTNVEGKMVAALRRIGFDKVFDTDFGADLTIIEEANELVERITNKGVLPMITSCSPGWVNFCEHYYPDQLAHLSSCKSPAQMFGAIAKSDYYAKKIGVDPKNIVCVSVMPCTAKKYECGRDDQSANGYPDVDYSITTRELGRLIQKCRIRFSELPDEEFDAPFGISTGAGTIFGATGGVMEAALRSAVDWLTHPNDPKLSLQENGAEMPKLEFTDVRGTKGIKEASYDVAGMKVKVAVASGLANAREILDKIRAGKADYHFVEIMACPGGCVNGGGQPQVPGPVRNTVDIRALRAKALYDDDKKDALRMSHKNPAIKELYDNFLKNPGSEEAHHYLHTSYVKRSIYKPISEIKR
jgi:NADP-reducing hydrogenase subunit HndD